MEHLVEQEEYNIALKKQPMAIVEYRTLEKRMFMALLIKSENGDCQQSCEVATGCLKMLLAKRWCCWKF